jgi:tape measure domain-containing protein
MADTVSRLAIQVGMDTKQLQSGVGQASGILSTLASRFTLAVDPIQLVGQGVSMLARGASEASRYLMDLAGTTETVGLALSFAADSAAEFNQLMSTTMDFGAGQFEDNEIANVVRQLKLFGAEGQNIGGVLDVMGRLAIGSGNSLESVASVLQRIRFDGEVTFKDLRQLMQMNIPITDELAKSLGVTKGEIVAMAEGGKISLEQVNEALAKLTIEGGRFGEAIEMQTDTLAGSWKELWDSLDDLFRPLASLLGGIVKELIKGLTILVKSANEFQMWMLGSAEATDQAAGAGGKFVEEMSKGEKAAEGVEKSTKAAAQAAKKAADEAKRMRHEQEAATRKTFDPFFKMQEEANRLRDSLATPQEAFAKEQERLRELLSAGAIDPQTFGRAMEKANNALKEHARAAREAADARQRLNNLDAPQGLVRGTSGAASAVANFRFNNPVGDALLQQIVDLLRGGPVIRKAGLT